MAVFVPDPTVAPVDDQFASLIACDLSRFGNCRLLCRQHNRIALVALTEHRPPVRPLNYMLIDIHLFLDNTGGGWSPTVHGQK